MGERARSRSSLSDHGAMRSRTRAQAVRTDWGSLRDASNLSLSRVGREPNSANHALRLQMIRRSVSRPGDPQELAAAERNP